MYCSLSFLPIQRKFWKWYNGTIFTYKDQSSGKEINRYIRFPSNASFHWSTLTCNATTRTAADVNTVYRSNVRVRRPMSQEVLMKSINCTCREIVEYSHILWKLHFLCWSLMKDFVWKINFLSPYYKLTIVSNSEQLSNTLGSRRGVAVNVRGIVISTLRRQMECWSRLFSFIFSIHLQKIYSARKTAIIKLCFDHWTCHGFRSRPPLSTVSETLGQRRCRPATIVVLFFSNIPRRLEWQKNPNGLRNIGV